MSELSEKLKSEAQALAQPLSADAPSGTDISYEPEFDEVRGEIDKLTAMAGEAPNWALVVSAGEELLKEKTKDMRLVIWVAAARMKQGGWEGLAAGIAGVDAVCRAQWDTMFPPLKRAKARGKLAGWLGDMILAHYGDYVPSAQDKAGIDVVEVMFTQLDELLTEKLDAKYEGMGPIRSLLRDKNRMLPATVAPAAVASPAAISPQPGTAAPAPAAALPVAVAAPQPVVQASPAAPAMAPPQAPTMSGAADVLPALRSLGKGIVEAARHLRQADPSAAWAYRLARIGIWLAVKQTPPAEGGKTKIPAPQANDSSRLQSLFEGQQWGELLNHAEGLTGRFLFWLDLHRFVAIALDRQGARYQEAKEAVIHEVLNFVRQHPQVLELSFNDGTHFANEATKTWLEEEQSQRAPSGANAGSGTSVQLDEEEEELRARFQTARELALGGKVAEGLSLAIQLSRRSKDARSTFRAKLETAQLALKASKPELARPLLDGLVAEAETHGLEHWEPTLCAELYAALLKSRRASASNSHEPSDGVVLDRLCRLDPAAAMKANSQ